MAAAANSLPPRARRVRPVVPPRTRITTTPVTDSATSDRSRNARSLEKSTGPITGRGTRRGTFGPPIQSTLTSTFSKKRAKASVASVR